MHYFTSSALNSTDTMKRNAFFLEMDNEVLIGIRTTSNKMHKVEWNSVIHTWQWNVLSLYTSNGILHVFVLESRVKEESTPYKSLPSNVGKCPKPVPELLEV